jgi:hypothetical protein
MLKRLNAGQRGMLGSVETVGGGYCYDSEFAGSEHVPSQ